MRRALQVLIALLLLWLVLRNLDLSSLADALGRLRIASIAMAVALFFLSCGLGTMKWRVFWRRATWWQMLNANFVAQFYSLLLPGQLAGEIVKTFRVGHRFSDTTNVAASVVVDRAAGLAGLIILAFVGALLSPGALAPEAILVLGLAAAGILGMFCAMTHPRLLGVSSSLIGRLGDRFRCLQPATRKTTEFLSAWVSLTSNPGTTLAAVCLGIAYQGLCVGINFVIASDLGINVGFADWCWVFGLVSVALLLPITIAGIGVREVSYAGLLGLLGVAVEKAVIVSIVVFGISLLGVLAGGLVEFASAMRAREDSPS